MGTKEELRKTFSANLIYYMNLANKTQADIIRDLKYGSGIVSEWVNGKKYPRIDKIQALADYLNIHKYQLIEPLSLHKQRKVNSKIPLYKRFLIEEEKVDYIVYDNKQSNHEYFALTITNNTLHPEFHKNDVVIVERVDKLSNGQIAVIKLKRKIQVRKVKTKKKQIFLETLLQNKKDDTIEIQSLDEIEILGVIKELKRFY
ncbi:repressor LexA [Breznakia sp. PF5-3]|uniref:S24 family peptidase n=1 Tax=unclassified Breznakia TaxID=2623764 RepID=UPI0024055FBD|nr:MULTISPECIES: S24 family peptidase [unclassified Breznakia]MDF9825001.1 repressor LexA [Breznakia sp. PM6-1]MDF9835428.1 repressor LexA [Breznakia sp. PF5-3]MDF9837660.1 repressor LexA [Breznakia sp. PFB2-8]MDF9859524.1 repressor LexA [Breznakia sp. PH5-24]